MFEETENQVMVYDVARLTHSDTTCQRHGAPSAQYPDTTRTAPTVIKRTK